MKQSLKSKAIGLRRKGLSYSEVLQKIPVAKSTLSLWLRSVGLSKRQKQRLTEKKLLASQRGGDAKRLQRINTTKRIYDQAKKEIGSISDKELLFLGTILYWAEGSKSKEHNPSQGVIFSNSDPLMIRLIIKWFKICLRAVDNDILFEIYVHETYRNRLSNLKKFWSESTRFPIAKFDKIYFKKDKLKTVRKNIGDGYYGQLRVKVRKSTNLNRKITGWVAGIFKQCGVV